MIKLMDLVNSAGLGMEEFIDKLIEEKNFSYLTDDISRQLKKDLSQRLDEFIAARVIAGLSDEDVLVFEDMLQNNDSPENVQQFVSAHVPDFVNFLTNTLLEFRGVYLGKIN